MKELNKLERAFDKIRHLETVLDETMELVELAEMEADEGMAQESLDVLKALQTTAAKAELEALLSGEADGNNAFVEIHPGAGGTEAQDWAAMLLRMYVRWANTHGYKVEVLEEQSGDEAGLKSATIL
ncbi:MAG TPA: PCRF domain-containing protein, partial [Hellea balneolensis]|nr:PCRF domain-containing protein [Hellea balneolensis]